MAFTEMNTDGFSANELGTLNNALATLTDAHPGVNEENITDLINNAFYAGITEGELVMAVENSIKAS